MKKLVLFSAVVFVVSLASCKKSAENAAPATDSVQVEQTIEATDSMANGDTAVQVVDSVNVTPVQ